MAREPYLDDIGPPPATLDAARNRRQRVRTCGLDPDHWYIVEHASALKPGEVKQIVFWKRPIALFRGADGEYRAIDDRCAHRQVSLAKGDVIGCQLVCQYHGWGYDGDGRVASISHELYGRKFPKVGVHSFPVKIRYGMVWIFPGDAKKAATTPLPHLPELEGDDRWLCVPFDFTWKAHHSMVIDNVSDYAHGWLHRKYEPFRDARLVGHETIGDTVHVHYNTKIAAGWMMDLFIDRESMDSNHIHLVYDYPYHTSNTDDYIKHFICVVPIDERTSRTFFLFYYKQLKVPFTPWKMPRPLGKLASSLGNRFMVKPLIDQDGGALESEQEGWEAAWDAPVAELNPIVGTFQELTIKKWQQYLERQAQSPKRKRVAAKRRAPLEGAAS